MIMTTNLYSLPRVMCTMLAKIELYLQTETYSPKTCTCTTKPYPSSVRSLVRINRIAVERSVSQTVVRFTFLFNIHTDKDVNIRGSTICLKWIWWCKTTNHMTESNKRRKHNTTATTELEAVYVTVNLVCLLIGHTDKQRTLRYVIENYDTTASFIAIYESLLLSKLSLSLHQSRSSTDVYPTLVFSQRCKRCIKGPPLSASDGC